MARIAEVCGRRNGQTGSAIFSSFLGCHGCERQNSSEVCKSWLVINASVALSRMSRKGDVVNQLPSNWSWRSREAAHGAKARPSPSRLPRAPQKS